MCYTPYKQENNKMSRPSRFISEGLQIQRLGQGRIELSAGAGGSFDTLTIGGVDLLPGGAVAFNASLTQTALDIAAAINANTNTHGFQCAVDAPDTNVEIIFYQVVPGALVSSTVAFTVTTITADYIRPTGFADNELYGDTDSFIALPLATPLAADDFGMRGVVRIDPDVIGVPREGRFKGSVGAQLDVPITVAGVVQYSAIQVIRTATARTEGFKFFDGADTLPVSDWQKGGWTRLMSVDTDGVFNGNYAFFI